MQHRKGSLHQTNKPFKGRRNSRKIVRLPLKSIKTIQNESKAARLNRAKQQREKRRDEFRQRHRLGGADAVAPKSVVFVPLHRSINTEKLKVDCAQLCPKSHPIAKRPGQPVTMILPPSARMSNIGETKPRISVIDTYPYAGGIDYVDGKLNKEALEATLDFAKAASVVVFVLPPTENVETVPIDATGYEILSAMRLQGMGTALGLIDTAIPTLPSGKNYDVIASKQQAAVKKLTGRFFTSELGQDAKWTASLPKLLALVCNATPAELSWRQNRGYLVVEKLYMHNERSAIIAEGYARGLGFNLRHGIHVTGIGDFQVSKMEVMTDPLLRSEGDDGPLLEIVASGDNPVPWKRLAEFDPLQGEQSLLTTDDFRRRPFKPMFDDNESTEEEQELNSDVEGQVELMHDDEGEAFEEDDDDAPPWDNFGQQEIDALEAEKSKRKIDLVERARDAMDFEDEVDTPLETPAQVRFQKYRGLRSFRNSPWDPFADLPPEYSRISEFEQFNRLQKVAMATLKDDCEELGNSGRYVRLELSPKATSVDGVAAVERLLTLCRVFNSNDALFPPVLLSTLMPFERNVTVNHLRLTRRKEFTEVLPSKQLVYIQTGFQRIPVKPLYSTAPSMGVRTDRLRYQRFFKPGDSVIASFFSAVLFPPCSSIVMMPDGDGNAVLAAWGSVLPPKPNKLIIKRIALTGYPFRTHKKKAVVRYMFFNPRDINYFQPTELTTQKGLKGHITEPLGTHGYMKCYFNDFIDASDTVSLRPPILQVIMHLYKRVYPKWHPESWGAPTNFAVTDRE